MPPVESWGARESSTRRELRAGLQPPPDEEDESAGDEQDELAPDVSAEHAVEECGPRDEQSHELERARYRIHGFYGVSATVTRVIRSPCSILSTTSWPVVTCPNTV